MKSHDKISDIILKHWQNYHPKMLAQFQSENRLEAEVQATAEQFAELLYELNVKQKMDYSKAWEMAREQFLLPEEPDEEESSWTNPNQLELPVISA